MERRILWVDARGSGVRSLVALKMERIWSGGELCEGDAVLWIVA